MAKLLDWEIQAIADACIAGKEKRYALAVEFDVHPSTVTRIAQKHGAPRAIGGPRKGPPKPRIGPHRKKPRPPLQMDAVSGAKNSARDRL